MKISKMSFSATIPTGQYANIEPSIEFSDIDDPKIVQEVGIAFIKEQYAKFCVLGTLNEHEIKVQTTIDKIDEVGL